MYVIDVFEVIMNIQLKVPAVFMALLFSSMLVFAAGPKHLASDSVGYSSTDLVLFGALGVRLLSRGSG